MNHRIPISLGLAVLLLAACGGGGGDDPAATEDTTAVMPVTETAPVTVPPVDTAAEATTSDSLPGDRPTP